MSKKSLQDHPQPKIEVTEHRVETKKCPCCGQLNRATFPNDIKGQTQYGERVQALIAYFAHQHFIPVDRVCQIFEDLFGIGLSVGTCANIDDKLFRNLESFETSLKLHLIAGQVLHFDESGMRCEKKVVLGSRSLKSMISSIKNLVKPSPMASMTLGKTRDLFR